VLGRGTHGSTFTTLASDLGLTPRLALRIHMPFNTCGGGQASERASDHPHVGGVVRW
jgi:hypothetical protein